MCMKFESFITEIEKEIKKYLPNNYADAEVTITEIEKNNNVRLKAITIKKKGENITPTIYLERFYEKYVENEDMDEVLAEIAELRINADRDNLENVEEMITREYAKDKIIGTFIGREEWNNEMLKNYPYVKVLDLAMIFRIRVSEGENDFGTIKITKRIQEKLGYTTEELFELAKADLKLRHKPQMVSMQTVLAKMTGREAEQIPVPEQPLFVVSSENGTFGSNALIDTEFMNRCCDILEDDIVIIPSSIHELIIMRWEDVNDYCELKNMIQSVNETAVDDTDQLSDHPYIWYKNIGVKIL